MGRGRGAVPGEMPLQAASQAAAAQTPERAGQGKCQGEIKWVRFDSSQAALKASRSFSCGRENRGREARLPLHAERSWALRPWQPWRHRHKPQAQREHAAMGGAASMPWAGGLLCGGQTPLSRVGGFIIGRRAEPPTRPRGLDKGYCT